MKKRSKIIIHGPEEFKSMRRAGRLAAQVLDYVESFVVEGVTTGELNDRCHDFIIQNKATPAPLNYQGFPKSICTSVNHVVCHGIPGDKKLVNGDIMNIDVTVILDGWHGDTSRMYTVGKVGILASRLIQATYDATMAGIKAVRPGATLGDVGYAMQQVAQQGRFSVIEDFCGHGIGRVFHAEPSVLNFGKPGSGLTLQEGMFFTVEPMLNAGKSGVKVLKDGWTAVTRDRSLSAQFEHTVGVTKDGVEIFTISAV